MANVQIKIPGVAGIIEAKQALMAQAVAHQFSLITDAPPAAPEQKVRQPSAGDVGKPLQTARLA